MAAPDTIGVATLSGGRKSSGDSRRAAIQEFSKDAEPNGRTPYYYRFSPAIFEIASRFLFRR
jgi:hypothetical protein